MAKYTNLIISDVAAQLGQALKARGFMLAMAESCTGGLVAESITSIAGSSAWFDRGFVTYSNAAKIDMLGVSGKTLEAFGAVSEQTAAEMAAGALRNSTSQIAGSITGIAGPGGGSEEKPVGTVCFGWAGELSRTSNAADDSCHKTPIISPSSTAMPTAKPDANRRR